MCENYNWNALLRSICSGVGRKKIIKNFISQRKCTIFLLKIYFSARINDLNTFRDEWANENWWNPAGHL